MSAIQLYDGYRLRVEREGDCVQLIRNITAGVFPTSWLQITRRDLHVHVSGLGEIHSLFQEHLARGAMNAGGAILLGASIVLARVIQYHKSPAFGDPSISAGRCTRIDTLEDLACVGIYLPTFDLVAEDDHVMIA